MQLHPGPRFGLLYEIMINARENGDASAGTNSRTMQMCFARLKNLVVECEHALVSGVHNSLTSQIWENVGWPGGGGGRGGGATVPSSTSAMDGGAGVSTAPTWRAAATAVDEDIGVQFYSQSCEGRSRGWNLD